MSAKSTAGPGGKKPASAATNLIGKLVVGALRVWRCQRGVTDLLGAAGGGAGMMEALACHPLGKDKVYN
jgi:solute carrier family 25 citrate transporter 1